MCGVVCALTLIGIGGVLGCSKSEESDSTSSAGAGALANSRAVADEHVDVGCPVAAQADGFDLGVGGIDDWCLDGTSGVKVASSEHPEDLERRCREVYISDCQHVLALGLRKLTIGRFVRDQLRPAIVDAVVSRFSSPEGAWAFVTERYLSDLSLDDAEDARRYATLDGPHLGLLGERQLVAIHGFDVLSLRLSDRFRAVSEQRRAAAHELPAILAAWLSGRPDDQPLPRSLSLLPERDRRTLGRRFAYADALGVLGAGHGATGYYRAGEKNYRIFVASYPDEAAAKDAALLLRRRPGVHNLEDVSFDAFEFTQPGDAESPSTLWLMGVYGGRVAGVGSAPPPPTTGLSKGPKHWLERGEKLTLLRRVMSAR